MHIFRQWALPPGCPVLHRLADGDTCLGLLAAYGSGLPGGLQQLYDLNTGGPRAAWASVKARALSTSRPRLHMNIVPFLDWVSASLSRCFRSRFCFMSA